MNLQEFIVSLADVEGQEALAKHTKDFWQQASDEDKATIIQGIERLTGHVRKVVKSFWELCGVAYSNGWITVDGKSYTVSPEIKPDDIMAAYMYTSIGAAKVEGKTVPRTPTVVSTTIKDVPVKIPVLTWEQVNEYRNLTPEEYEARMKELIDATNLPGPTAPHPHAPYRNPHLNTPLPGKITEIKNEGKNENTSKTITKEK